MAASPKMCSTLTSPGATWDRRLYNLEEETVFKTRVGPDYKRNKRKEASGTAFYEHVGTDNFKTSKKALNVASRILLPKPPQELLEPVSGIPPYFIVTVLFPDYPMTMRAQQDGPTSNCVFYFMLKHDTHAKLHPDVIDQQPPAYRLWRDFVADDSLEMRDRFKMIPNVVNPADIGMNWMLTTLINTYNQKPFLTRPQHVWYTDHKTYVEVDIDVHIFGYPSRKGWDGLRSLVPRVVVEAALCVESREEDEMPENILCAALCHCIPINDIPRWYFDSLPVIAQYDPTVMVSDIAPHLYPPVSATIPPAMVLQNGLKHSLSVSSQDSSLNPVTTTRTDNPAQPAFVDVVALHQDRHPSVRASSPPASLTLSNGTQPSTPRAPARSLPTSHPSSPTRPSRSLHRPSSVSSPYHGGPSPRRPGREGRALGSSSTSPARKPTGFRRTSPMIKPLTPQIKIETTGHLTPAMLSRLERRIEGLPDNDDNDDDDDDEFHDALDEPLADTSASSSTLSSFMNFFGSQS